MIYVERSAGHFPFVRAVSAINANLKEIEDGEKVEDKKTNIVLTAKKDNFVHPCPGTRVYRCCNYHVADIMQGCPFDCSYCILQAYLPHKHIRVSADSEAFINSISESVSSGRKRIGTGELADSLALDHIIPLSRILVPIANNFDDIQLEFKTKSSNVNNLFGLNPKNVVVSWSLNPAEIAAKEEPLTAPVKRRLEAAKAVCDYGYKVGFHFDPLILCENFENLYGALIGELTSLIPEHSVEFISVSTFRCPPELMDAIRLRPEASILTKGDYVRGLDGKIRYFKALRVKMIKFAIESIRKVWKKPFIYMCMEHESLWKGIFEYDPGEREDFEGRFPFYG